MNDKPAETQYEAIIVGGGISGMVAASRMAMDLGAENVRVFEKGKDLGGTWYWNRYTNAGCDVPSRLYSISYAQRQQWSEFFPHQEEILEYLQEVGKRFNIYSKTTFESEVESATWSKENSHWIVVVKDLKSKEKTTITSRVLFSCVGAHSVNPRELDIPGASDFKGKIFHSARWDQSVDFKDQKVVVLGNGCSASQIIPGICKDTKSLIQIVRAKHWYHPQHHNPVEGRLNSWLEKHSTIYTTFMRWALVFTLESQFIQTFKVEGKGARARFEKRATNYIKSTAPKEYHDILIPSRDREGKLEVEVACKRRIFDGEGYIPCLNEKNVELTTDQCVKINENSITLKSGREVEADIIICANGFKSDLWSLQMEVINGDGVRLEDYWKQQGLPQAYRSTMVSSFPNLIITRGPFSATGHFSAIWSIERSVELGTTLLKPIFKEGPKNLTNLQRSEGKSVDVKKEAEDLEQRYIQDTHSKLIFSTGCGAWYAQPDGRVTAVAPTWQLNVAKRCRFPVSSDLIYRGLSQRRAVSHWSYLQQLFSFLRVGGTPDIRSNREAKRSYPVIVFNGITFPLRFLLHKLFLRFLICFSWIFDKTL